MYKIIAIAIFAVLFLFPSYARADIYDGVWTSFDPPVWTWYQPDEVDAEDAGSFNIGSSPASGDRGGPFFGDLTPSFGGIPVPYDRPVFYYNVYDSGGFNLLVTIPFYASSTDPNCSSPPCINTQSRIISTVPTNASTTATTTPIGATVYIAEEDWQEGMALGVSILGNAEAQLSTAIGALNAIQFDFEFPLEAGFNQVSTTTTFELFGDYSARWVVSDHSESFWDDFVFTHDFLLSTTTMFTVSTTTTLDRIVRTTENQVNNVLQYGTSTTMLSIDRCNPLYFDMTICLTALFVGSGDRINNQLEYFRTTSLQRGPMGFVTRFMTIIISTPTTTLPVLSLTFPDSFPVSALASESIEINPWPHLYQDGSVLKDELVNEDGNNIWEVIGTLFTMVMALITAFMIVDDVIGFMGRSSTVNNLDKHSKIK